MYRLYKFIYKYRAFLFFVILQIICFRLIFKYNDYQSSYYFNTSNYYTAQLLKANNDIKEYFSLRKTNVALAEENAFLRKMLSVEQQKKNLYTVNEKDLDLINRYVYIPAKVINNTISKNQNFITLDKGSSHGIKPEMGIVTANGIVGVVKNCSENFSTAISLLNTKWAVSSKIKRGNIDGTLQWEHNDPQFASLKFVPRHHKIYKGDTIVTSGYQTNFPDGVNIGQIIEIDDDNKSFYNIKVKLNTDFTSLSHVYVVENKLKPELDTLQAPMKKLP